MLPRQSPLVQRGAGSRKAAKLRMCLLAAALAGLPVPGFVDSAASQDAPRISVAPRIVAEPEAPAVLRIAVGPPDAIPPRSFISLRGLPPGVGLTEGHAIAPGAWAIPLNGLPTLKAYIPAGLSGENTIVISLIGGDGRLLATARAALIIPPQRELPSELQRAPAAQRPAEDGAAEPVNREAAERLLQRGEASLANGNVEVARQFFVRAVEMGLAAAALRLGATYDPGELRLMQAQGVVADAAQARKWYERARELGAPEASERLARLGR